MQQCPEKTYTSAILIQSGSEELVMIKQGDISSSYITQFVDYAREHGVTDDVIFSSVPLEVIKKIKAEKSKISVADYVRILENSGLDLSRAAFHLAQSSNVAAHGYLGLAAMCGFNLRKVLGLLVKFYRTRSNLLDLDMKANKSWVVLSANPARSLGKVENFTILITLMVMHFCKRQLLGDSCDDDILSLTIDKPDGFAEYANIFSGVVNFGASENSLKFPAAQLNENIKTANACVAETMEQHLEQELELSQQPNLVRAINEVFKNSTIMPDAKEVAAQLFISERTMRRQLAKVGHNFQSMLEDYRTDLACKMLANTNISLTEITGRLGFTDSSNFSKAFKRSVGQSPMTYRKKNSRKI
jgi:AraC-like DNA-binding protein